MRLAIQLMITVALAYLACYFLKVKLNPEVAFWTEAIHQRDREITAIRNENPGRPLVIFTGGSSCAFSVQPAIISKRVGMPVINLGLPAGSGRNYIFEQALRRCQPGDILVVGIEPDSLCYKDTISVPSHLGYALESSLSNPIKAVTLSTGSKFKDTAGWLSIVRPGLRYFITWVARYITGEGYRYKALDIRPGGRIETQIRLTQFNPTGRKDVRSLAQDGRVFLAQAASKAERKGVQMLYTFPWQLTQSEFLSTNRASNHAIAQEISSYMPVLYDPSSGCVDNDTLFSDSEWHLGMQGSRLRSEEIAESLALWLSDTP